MMVLLAINWDYLLSHPDRSFPPVAIKLYEPKCVSIIRSLSIWVIFLFIVYELFSFSAGVDHLVMVYSC